MLGPQGNAAITDHYDFVNFTGGQKPPPKCQSEISLLHKGFCAQHIDTDKADQWLEIPTKKGGFEPTTPNV